MKFSLPEKKIATAADRMQSKAERFFRPKTVGFLFAALVLVLALISILVLRHEWGQKSIPQEESGTDVSSNLTQETAGDKDFLIAFVDDSDQTIQMLAALHANESEGQLSVRYVSPEAVVNVNNMEDTLTAHYRSGSGEGLCAATAAYLQSTIDRYLLLDDDDFIAMTKMMGDFTMDIEERVESTYKGISFIIEPGTRSLTPDMLCKYFAYLCDSLYSGGEAAVTALLSELATRLFFDSTEPMDEHLQKFVDMSTTNVTAIDTGTYAASLPAYVDGRERIEILCDGVIL